MLLSNKIWRKGVRIIQGTGATNHRNMYWAKYDPYNFGDWVGPYIFQRLTGKAPLHCRPKRSKRQTMFYAAGSIMGAIREPEQAIVWGSGIISKKDVFAEPKKILAVRGPHTRERCLHLGYECPVVYGDPAILLPEFYQPKVTRGSKIGVIPHFVDYQVAVDLYDSDPNVSVIDVTQPIEKVIDAICECSVTVSSSLHGIIVSHAYGVPSAWIKFSDKLDGDGIKFLDYFHCSGSNEEIAPVRVERHLSADTLEAFARETTMPDLDRLRDPLLRSCPFAP